MEALEELLPTNRVESSPQVAEQVDHLPTGEVRPQIHFTGHVGKTPVQRHGVVPWVMPQQGNLPAVGAQQPEENADRGRLPRAIRSEEAVNLARLDTELEMVERPGTGPEVLDESIDLYGGRHRCHLLGSWAPRNPHIPGLQHIALLLAWAGPNATKRWALRLPAEDSYGRCRR